ncbi:MAG: M64 family metallopeptidase [Oscillatoriaceae cyanobacterium Prado104]|nr:M64 family metallopeptidase [Oscillatoriaceae cyanobacterium Prado104]
MNAVRDREELMRITPPRITVDPPPMTVDPPPVTVTPPSFTVTPPQMTVTPPSVTVGGKSYTPPSITVTPPSLQVNPPPMTVDPPPMTIDPPPMTVALPAIDVEPEEEQTYVIVNPPPMTVDPPPITVDPPSITVNPPPVTVNPPPLQVNPPSFKVDPPGLLPPITIDPPSFTVDPPPFTVNPPPLTVDLPPIAVDPPPITIDPPPMVVNFGDFTWGSSKFTTLVQNGKPENRLDIVFIGDGYTQAEQDKFRGDVQKAIQAFRETEPMKTYDRHFNFHRVDVISPESGTDNLFAIPPVIRRTALHTFYSPIGLIDPPNRRLVGPDPWVRQVVNMSGVPWDEIIVLVNAPCLDSIAGATLATMQIAYISTQSKNFSDVVIHEAGHSIANLMDEYDAGLPDIHWPQDWVLPPVLPWVNVDTDPLHPKWEVWLTPGVSLPTPTDAASGAVGAFEGAAYTKSGVYRPQANCCMRNNGQPFCVVCTEAWIASIYRRSRLADGFLPRYSEHDPPLWYRSTQEIKFKAQVVRSNGIISTTWYTRNQFQASWQERQRTLNYADFKTTLSPGMWQVKCVLTDTSTSIRTPEVRDLARQEHIWNIITT